MQKFNISGMSCAACSARVEKAVSSLDGVSSCSVNLLTNSMVVEGSANEKEIINAVVKAGYGVTAIDNRQFNAKDTKAFEDTETPVLKKRFFMSLGFLIVLMYFSMGHTMFGFPLPSVLQSNHILLAGIQLLLSLTVMIINKKFFVSGVKGVLNRSPNMDTLVALGSSASFVYSLAVFILMSVAQLEGNMHSASEYKHDLYFESAAMILVLITVGKMLESRSKGKTTDAIKSLMNLAPKTAVVIADGKETEISVSLINKGDIFILKPGSTVPVDGTVIDGVSAVDESALTGESLPVDKTKGDSVSAGTMNKSGYLKCEALRVGEDTTLSQIIRMVSDASATKAPIAKIADKVSGVFVPIVIAISVITFVIWLIAGESVGFSVARAISVLVISCPCALGLATPVAIMVANGVGARNGILFKTAVSLETAGRVNTVVLDKTGTVTEGKPKVTEIITTDGVSQKELLKVAYALEIKSEHPLALAIVQKCNELSINNAAADAFTSHSGHGVSGIIDGKNAMAGNVSFIERFCNVDDNLKLKAERLSLKGNTPLWFVLDGKLIGIIAVADVIKNDSRHAVEELKNMGIRVVMLTGDNQNTAVAIGKQAGIDEVIADVLPDGKEKVIRDLQKNGRVAMVGDGINDSPALTRADVGIAIGTGTDVAVDSADVVLINSRLSDVPAAIRLSRAALRNIHQNLFWAFIYNIIGIPLAAGVWYPIFGLLLNPMFGAAAMSLSSFCVVSNALRLNLVNIHSTKSDRRIKTKTIKEKKIMEKTVKIEGMMCPHCEARVKTILEELAEVDSAIVSHENGTAILTLNSKLSDEKVKAVVEAQGYKLIG